MRQFHAHCVCAPAFARLHISQCVNVRRPTFVVGKNYRLQDIQLSNNALESHALEEQQPSAYRPLRNFRLRRSFSLANASNFFELVCPLLVQSRRRPTFAKATRATFACIHERRLENTGLEPVTSWLQTRRSPS